MFGRLHQVDNIAQGCQIGDPQAGSITHWPRPLLLHEDKNHCNPSGDVIKFDTCDIGLEETMQKLLDLLKEEF